MQKKSLLVALFCGALCLTGCLKNEESASVVQVRTAKANELNSIAKLNEAKAAAEAVYAEAALTVAKAEAELKNAQANLTNAQAETEKVRTELMKVNVQLAEVVLDEEKVKLEILKANLESRLAALEAEKAAAEAAKQAWINTLNQLLADAEVQAIENAQALLEAEEKIEAYVLTLEAQKADSVKKYSYKYFRALNRVQDLQKKQLEIKAQKALVEAGAEVAKDAIHFEIDQLNEQIDENNALIAALKARQAMGAKEAEAALADARLAAGDAYAAYKAAVKAEDTANKDNATVWGKTADFTQNWDRKFKEDVKDFFDYDNPKYDLYHHRFIDVTVGDEVERVWAGGIIVPGETEDETEFIPFWNDERRVRKSERYPDIYVSGYETAYPNKPVDYVTLTNTTIVPAQIYYDNIDAALDATVLLYEAYLEEAVKDFKEELTETIEGTEEDEGVQDWIDANKEQIALHKAYVDARKAKVAAAEEAYIAELKKHETFESDKAAAWKAFQDYMLVNHDETRALFIERNQADSAYAQAVKDTVAAWTALQGIAEGIPALVKAVDDEFPKFAKAEGEYNLAKYNSENGKGATAKAAVNAAKDRWNPDFDDAVNAGAEPQTDNAASKAWKGTKEKTIYIYPYDSAPGARDGARWYVKVGDVKVYAGSAQDTLWTANANIEIAEAVAYKAEMDMLRWPSVKEDDEVFKGFQDTKADAEELKTSLNTELKRQSTGIEAVEAAAAKKYKDLKGEYDEQFGNALAKATKAYNPKFNDNDIFSLCTFPTKANPNAWHTISIRPNKEGKWVKVVNGKDEEAGTAQAALLDAAMAAADAFVQFKGSAWWTGKPTALDNWNVAKWSFNSAKARLLAANIALMEAMGVDFEELEKDEDFDVEDYVKENIADFKDTKAEQLYQAYKAVEDESEIEDALADLQKAYTIHPDAIGELRTWDGGWFGVHRVSPRDNVYGDEELEADFGWLLSSYMVDYKATMVDVETGERIPIASYLYPYLASDDPDETIDYHVAAEVRYSVDFEDGEFEVEEETVHFDKDGNEVPKALAEILPDYRHSLTWENEQYQKFVDAKAELIEEAETLADKMVEGFEEDIDDIKTAVVAYKAYENDYKTWNTDRAKAEQKWNQTKKDLFDAKQAVNDAEADVTALEDVANQKAYVYFGDAEGTKVNINGHEYEVGADGYVELTIADEIAYLEGGRGSLITGVNALADIATSVINSVIAVDGKNGDVAKIKEALSQLKDTEYFKGDSNFELKAAKKILEKALEYGKLALQTVVEIYDDEIEELDEKIEVWNAIAAKYKAIMNAYLDIVDEAVVEEEDGDEE